jgi:nucleoside-diphosphate-sugar epimerase
LKFLTLPHATPRRRQAPGWCTCPATGLLRHGASYDETHPPDPVTPYGAAKAAAETAVKGITLGAVIARTSLIIGGGDSQHGWLVRALAAGALLTNGSGAGYPAPTRCSSPWTRPASHG